jgi:uncharacterized protein YegP (UPF0339 family)
VAAVTTKYEFFRYPDGTLGFRLKAANGKIIAGSAGCKSQTPAHDDAGSGRHDTAAAAAVEHVETPHDTALRKQRMLNARAKPFKIFTEDGHPL